MDKKKDTSQEKAIWELYQKQCKMDGTTPSVQGFKEWTTSLLKKL